MIRWLVIVLALAAASACGGEAAGDRAVPARGAAAPPETGEVDASRGTETRRVVYVDVRTPQEYAAGHVQGAIHIPHTELPDRWGELESHKDDRILLYCRTGRRSGIAMRILHEKGFEHLENAGGLSELARQGVPTTR